MALSLPASSVRISRPDLESARAASFQSPLGSPVNRQPELRRVVPGVADREFASLFMRRGPVGVTETIKTEFERARGAWAAGRNSAESPAAVRYLSDLEDKARQIDQRIAGAGRLSNPGAFLALMQDVLAFQRGVEVFTKLVSESASAVKQITMKTEV